MKTNLTMEARALQKTLGLRWPPISVTFTNDPPSDIVRIDQPAPSGCTYWKHAAEGNVFYTDASDHYGCTIGAYTHGVELPPALSKQLDGMIKTMVDLSYLKKDEVAAIPRRENSFRFAIYAPLADAPVEPDVVIVRGNAKQMMLLAEAMNATDVSSSSGIKGRPTCAMIPTVMKMQQSAMSLGCIGNRVYNQVADEEMYAAMPGIKLTDALALLSTIVDANSELERFHFARLENI